MRMGSKHLGQVEMSILKIRAKSLAQGTRRGQDLASQRTDAGELLAGTQFEQRELAGLVGVGLRNDEGPELVAVGGDTVYDESAPELARMPRFDGVHPAGEKAVTRVDGKAPPTEPARGLDHPTQQEAAA